MIGALLFPREISPTVVAAASAPRHIQNPPIKTPSVAIPTPHCEAAETEKHLESRTAAPVETAKSAVLDADEVFMKRIESLPLDRANLEISIEVERRIKVSETTRAKLIYSEKKDGKYIIGYAVKQPTLEEVKKNLSLYQKFLNSQTDSNSKQYVDSRFEHLVSQYAMMQGNFRLLYATIPETFGSSVLYFSYAASSEQECMDILKQELAPKPPMVIGVTYKSREGLWGLSREIIPNRWRMDHLIAEDLLKPFFIKNFRSAGGANLIPVTQQ